MKDIAGADERYFEVDDIDALVDVFLTIFRRTVNFNANGGTVEPEKVTVPYGHHIGEIINALPTPTKEGHSFLGWFTATGEPCDNLPTPTCTGYDFDGWFTAQDGGSQIQATTVVKLESDSTLYAHWSNPTAAANFTVVNAQSLEPMPGAQISVSGLTDTTDEYGQARMILPLGKHTVSVAAPGCITRNVTITITDGENKIPTIGVSDKPLYEVELKPPHEMTLDEIIAAGIDTQAREHQHVYRYEILNFQAPHIMARIIQSPSPLQMCPISPCVISVIRSRLYREWNITMMMGHPRRLNLLDGFLPA